MKERTSQTLLLVEVIILLAPITVLTTFYALALLAMYCVGLSDEPAAAHVVPAFTFLGFILQLCGWRIVIAFIAQGRRGIADVPIAYFYVVALAAFLVLMSLLLLILVAAGTELPTYAYGFTAGYLAAPALIPCCHVLAERAFAARRNVGKSMPEQVLASRE